MHVEPDFATVTLKDDTLGLCVGSVPGRTLQISE
jgi:hypothetical protein